MHLNGNAFHKYYRKDLVIITASQLDPIEASWSGRSGSPYLILNIYHTLSLLFYIHRVPQNVFELKVPVLGHGEVSIVHFLLTWNSQPQKVLCRAKGLQDLIHEDCKSGWRQFSAGFIYFIKSFLSLLSS